MTQRLTFDTLSVVVSFTDQPAWVRGLLCANKEMEGKLWKVFMDAAAESRYATEFRNGHWVRRKVLRAYADSEATVAYCEAIVERVERGASPAATSADRKVGERAAFAVGCFHGKRSFELAVRYNLVSVLVSFLMLTLQRWELTASAEPVPSRSFERTVALAMDEFIFNCGRCGCAYQTGGTDLDEICDLMNAIGSWNPVPRDEDFIDALDDLFYLLEEDIEDSDPYSLPLGGDY